MMKNSAFVVDDSKSARFALRKFLEGFNYQVETAESASEAFRLLDNTLPTVIFLDHIMPGIDGFEALRVLKSNPRTAAVPVVICSSNEGDDFVAQAKARGASNVLQKPPSPEQLAGVLGNLVNQPVAYKSALSNTRENTRSREDSLAKTLSPSLMPKRELSAMDRLMATIPPKMIPTAHLLPGGIPAPQAQPAPAAPAAAAPPVAPRIAAELPQTRTVATPPPVMAAPKVQPLREPAVTIQQAVMKSIRDSMPQATPAQSAKDHHVPSPQFSADASTASALVSLREEMDARISSLRKELMEELAALRAQVAGFSSSAADEKLRAVAAESARSHTSALAANLEQHVASLRNNIDAVLQGQSEKIEQLLENSRQTAAEEAERTVMKAAQRISDQMAESILKTLGPQLSNMRRL